MNWRYEIIEEARDRVMAKRIVSAIEKLFKRDRVLFEIDAKESWGIRLFFLPCIALWDSISLGIQNPKHEIRYKRVKKRFSLSLYFDIQIFLLFHGTKGNPPKETFL